MTRPEWCPAEIWEMANQKIVPTLSIDNGWALQLRCNFAKALIAAKEQQRDVDAKIITDNIEAYHGNEKFLQPRYEGDLVGLAYAKAIKEAPIS